MSDIVRVGRVGGTLLLVRGRIRGWWPLAAVALLLVAALWLLLVVWRSSDRGGLATYGAFAVPMLTLMAGWVAWARRSRIRSAVPAGAGQEMDHVADLLAIAVKMQWERAASERGLAAEPIPVTWGRPSLPLAGPAAAAVGSRRFPVLPELALVREAQLAAGQLDDLHAVYGGLRSGRLVIAGPPGAGKSSAAVLLVLAALKHRDRVSAEDRAKVPVPVLFTAQDWDPRRQHLEGWLVRRLQQSYPLFAGWSGAEKAQGLIGAGKIAVILDGLDEIAAELRSVALQALNQAGFRVVLLSRTAEMASAASQHGVLHGAAAVELRVIDPATASGYLDRVQLDPPPRGWQDLIDRIRASPASPLAEALNNPLTLTLIRDTYQSGDDARELLDHCDTIQQRVSGAQATEQITDHLLDRVLPAAYAPQPGRPSQRYDLQTAQSALAKIAARMNQDGTRDLQWWRIPRWLPAAPRIAAGGLAACFAVGLVSGLVSWSMYRRSNGLDLRLEPGLLSEVMHIQGVGIQVGLATGFLAGVVAGVAARGATGQPALIGRIGRPRLRQVFTTRNLRLGGVSRRLPSGLVFAILFVLLFFSTSSFWTADLAWVLEGWTRARVAVGLVAGSAGGLADAFVDPDSTSSPSPAISWRNDQRHSMTIGLMVGLAIGLMVGLVSALAIGLSNGLKIGILAGLAFAPIAGIGISHAWPAALATAQLARRWHTPLHLMNFLEDARERNVLRTVGPLYQFRHARLQDRLAASAPADRSKRSPSVVSK